MNSLAGVLSLDKRASEVLYGIILTLSVTSSLQAVSSHSIDMRSLFAATFDFIDRAIGNAGIKGSGDVE